MSRPLLIGQAPSRNCASPWASDAGRRLARYMGISHEELLEVFEPRNLNECHPGAAGKYDRFDLVEARETAARLRRYVLPRRPLALVCGVATARCFGWRVMDVTAAGRCLVYTLPHPAGTSMWWNDRSNRLAGSTHARVALAYAREHA